MPLAHRSVSLAIALSLAIPYPALAQETIELSSTDASNAGNASTLRIPLRFSGGYQSFGGDGQGVGHIEGFIPLWQTPGNSVTYLDPRFTLSDGNNIGGGLSLGHRFLSGSTVLGGHFSYDLRTTDRSSFNQLGLGLEALGDGWDLHLNGYLPVGSTRTLVSSTGATANQVTNAFFQGNNLFLQLGGQRTTQYETALGGVDFEGGLRLSSLDNGGDIKAYGGLYYLAGQGTASTVGGRLRLAVRPTSTLNVGLGVQSDGIFGTRMLFSVGATFPGYAAAPPQAAEADALALWARAGESIVRSDAILVDQQTVIEGTAPVIEAAINPATGVAYVFRHVTPNAGSANQGDGQFETPFTTLGTSGGAATTALGSVNAHDVVYVHPGDTAITAIAAFTVPANVQVLSTGVAQNLPVGTSIGNLQTQLPESGIGPLPVVTGSGGAFGVQLVGGNNVLSGFNVSNATSGIRIDGSTNAIVRDNIVSQAVLHGILADSTNNALIERNTISQTGLGIVATGNVNVIIQSNRVSQSGTNALGIPTPVVAAINVIETTGTVLIDGNTITDTTGTVANAVANLNAWAVEGGGIAVTSTSTTGANSTITITNNIIADTRPLTGNTNRSGDGIVVSFANPLPGQTANPTAAVNISNNTIQNVGTVDGANIRGDGIKIGLEENSAITSLTIANNVIQTPVDEGIDVSLGLAEGVVVGIAPSNARLSNATISNNQVTNSSNGSGLEIRTLGSNSRAVVTAHNNTLNNNANTGFLATTADLNGALNTTLCLAFAGNVSSNGYTLTEIQAGVPAPFTASTFAIVDRDNVGPANTGTVTFTGGVGLYDNLANLGACP